ncbi:MAG: FAD-dependent oxidoreductase, partial [Siphonobacter aquaeclarae]|nr:FAD-dependent oxidoreductase [Siphonobacter aquaeclarae]
MNSNIPKTSQKRVVIIGAGFGGLALARKLAAYPEIQTVLLDKNNFHQFQPLFYQVAMA